MNSRNILIIDDNPADVKELRTNLESFGYKVFSISNQTEELDMVQLDKVDIIIMEIRLPDLKGFNMFERLKDAAPEKKIIVTGSRSVENAVDAIKWRTDDFLLKPIDVHQMKKTVHRLLDEKIPLRKLKQYTDTSPIQEISEELCRVKPLSELHEHIFSIARKITGADEGSVCIVEEEDGRFEHTYSYGADETMKGKYVYLADRICNWVLKKRMTVLVSSPFSNDERFTGLEEPEEIKSWMSVPMVINDRLVGIINLLVTRGKRKFTKRDAEFISIFAHQAAAAVQNARDFEKLKEIDKMKSDFVSIVAHELKTPLTGIIGFSRTLLNLELSEEQKKRYLGIIETEGKRLASLVNDFLDISNIESGILDLEIDTVSIPDIVRKARGIETAGAERIKTDFPENFPQVRGDKNKLEQVIMNVIDNALRYNPPDEKVSVSGRDINGEIEIRIADRGPGMTKEEAERAFDRFYRGDKKGRGSGLGLSIARGILEAHRGNIKIESEPGKGTVVAFRLPKEKTGIE
jgi:signal transduction histidine kinase/FixJ family two-component response regulator